MIKVVGQLIELDPNKKYVMLIERDILSEEDMRVLALHMQKQEGAMLAITLPHFDAIKFVENSDRVVDITAEPLEVKKEDTGA